MEIAEKRCILCDSPDRSLLFQQGQGSVYRCNGCGLGVLDPRPDPEELSELYRSGYFDSHYDEGLKLDSPELRRRILQEKHRTLGIPVGIGNNVDYPPESFDIITMWHFLEHAREPEKYLQKASNG